MNAAPDKALLKPAASDRPASLIDCLFYYEQRYPAQDAVASADFTLSYAHLAGLVRAQARQFLDAGIARDSVIGINCADDTRHLVSCLAAIHLGAASCTIASHETDEARHALMSRCGVSHVVDDKSSLDPRTPASHVEALPAFEPVSADASAARLLFSTSGTTGEPKLVVHYARDLAAQAHRHIGSRQERFVCLASMEHNFAKRHRLYCVAQGATNVFIDADPGTLVARCHALRVNVMHVSAFQAQELLAIADIGQLSPIRLKLGGSHVPLALRQQLRNGITHELQAGYGTTETGAISFTDADDTNAGESVGQPLPGIEIRSVAPDGKPLHKGETGELAIRCDGMFREYLGNSGLTEARLKDGWFFTGDIGYQDQQERIHLCGRADDMFMFNSVNIYPQDIESQICQHPEVMDAAVLPRASSVHGNIPVALVVFAPNPDPDLPGLEQFVRERVGIRCPRQFTIVDRIPRNASGKIARRDVMSLSKTVDRIRASIVQALNLSMNGPLKPALVAAFAKGDEDIRLDDVGLDSLARMSLLVALEVEYDSVITPWEFGEFRTLGDIVTRVLSPPSQQPQPGVEPALSTPDSVRIDAGAPPYLVRFFRRVFSYCRTVAHLHKALVTLEYRLTPSEVECLREWHLDGQLIPACAAAKFQVAVSRWLDSMQRMLLACGKREAEPFVVQRIAPTVTHCIGPGSPAEKTLLVCFASIGSRHLLIPNAVLMQYTDSARYDLLIISEPLNAGYRLGVPLLGSNVTEVVEWIGKLDLLRAYGGVRTLGCSAGGYAAVIAGFLLGAEMAVCVGGRFPTKQYLTRLKMVYTTWKAVRRGNCSRIIISYATDNSRDRKYARIMARLTGGGQIAIEISNDPLGHTIFPRLLERGELAPYLERTIFAGMDDESIANGRASSVLSFPGVHMRSNG